ncbi:hypothetical protein [Acidithiobacillus sp. AMEEHan]|uniref:hypothetical protein n=1 Tax=Acidithiobacillus sp. AMEEHan TaxID=2994951 RepID=UPI0027E51B7F|nr:hypothetical protein [Acidithiobacillus sp. AMEEHan]
MIPYMGEKRTKLIYGTITIFSIMPILAKKPRRNRFSVTVICLWDTRTREIWMQGQMGEKTRAKDINLEYYLLLMFNRFGFLRHWESGTPSKNDPPERVEELMIVAMRRRYSQ